MHCTRYCCGTHPYNHSTFHKKIILTPVHAEIITIISFIITLLKPTLTNPSGLRSHQVERHLHQMITYFLYSYNLSKNHHNISHALTLNPWNIYEVHSSNPMHEVTYSHINAIHHSFSSSKCQHIQITAYDLCTDFYINVLTIQLFTTVNSKCLSYTYKMSQQNKAWNNTSTQKQTQQNIR